MMEQKSNPPRLQKRTAILLSILIVLIAVLLGGGWYFSNLVRDAGLQPRRVDLGSAIDHGVRQRGLPAFLPGIGKFLARVRFGVDWKALNYLSRVDELNVPILLFHGDADTAVPVETSDALAQARPDIVSYHRVPDATHVRSWNMNPDRYEATVREFLEGVMGE